jgi:endonuclease YncB( thermonuclease family)
MSLTQKFREALSDLTVSVSPLRHDERYRVIRAKRIETRHGKRVELTLIEDGDDKVISVFCQNDTATQWRTVTYMTLTLDVYNIIYRIGARVQFSQPY